MVLAPDFMTKIGKKAAQDFFCAVSKVFDRVKTVALWSATKRKRKRTIKGYGSAASVQYDSIINLNGVGPYLPIQHTYWPPCVIWGGGGGGGISLIFILY